MYGTYALAYAKKGMAVTPLHGKRPFVDAWEQTTASTVLIDSSYKNSNIGLLCGEPSGVIVIDIDTLNPDIEKVIIDSLPKTPVMKKGKKGLNFFFRYNGEKTVNYKHPLSKKDMIFELISTGRQTVLPPSIHPDTKEPYQWCDIDGNISQNTLLSVPLEDLPFLPEDWIASIDAEVSRLAMLERRPEEARNVGGIAALLSASDIPKLTHSEAADYNPKSLEDIPEGYRDRSRSGSHQAIAEKIMSLINKRTATLKVIREVKKFDAEYNKGYASNYYNCRTCNIPGSTIEEKIKAHYADLLNTVTKKKVQAGEEIPLPEGESSKSSREMEVVAVLINKFGIVFDPETTLVDAKNSSMITQDGDIFRYMNDGRWSLCEDKDIRAIKRMIQKCFGTSAKNKDVEATYKLFLNFIPTPPHGVNMHQGNPYALCLTNGTLHLVENDSGYGVDFREHSRADFLVNKLEMEYDPEFKEENKEFMQMLDRLFAGDPDRVEKITAVQECFGAAILPVFPKITFFHGEPGCGKSSVILALSNLLSNENVGRIDPSDFKGFLLEPLIGKLVNIVTDIKDAPIEAATLKQIEDRIPFNIQRKGRKNIAMPLPAFHLFGGNKLPKNFDTDTNAFERRVVFVRFNNNVTKENGKGNYEHDRNFAHRVFKANPQGILNFAIKGAMRLCESNGQYTQPASGWDTLKDWQSKYSSMDQFIKDIESGEVEGAGSTVLTLNENYTITRAILWQNFRNWLSVTGRGNKITRTAFYEELGRRFKLARVGNSCVVKGIGAMSEEYQHIPQASSAEIPSHY